MTGVHPCQTRSRRTILASLGALAATGAVGRSLATDGTDEDSNTVPTDGSTDWPTYRGNNHRTGATVENAAPNSEYVTTAWQADEIYSYGGLASEPVVADGAAYYTYQIRDLSGRGGIVAFDAETGEVRWRREGSPGDKEDIGTSYVPPTVGGGRVYFESTSFAGEDTGFSDYGGLYALDTGTGETVWRQPDFESEESLTLFAEGTLFVGGRALDAETGETLWTNGREFVGMAGGLVYGYEDPETLLGVDPDTGDVEQSIEVEIPLGRFDTVALTEETIYWSTSEHEIVAVWLDDGSMRWRRTLERTEPYVSAPAIGDETVYVHASPFDDNLEASKYDEDAQSTVYALNASTGERRWEFDTPTVLVGDPTVAGDSVYVGGHAFPKRELDLEAIPVYTFPTVHALSIADGSERWNYLIREPATPDETVNTARTPVVANSRIYVGWHQNVGSIDQNVRLTALNGTSVAPDSWNLPRFSTAPVARILVDPEGDDEPDRGPANSPENDAYEDFDGGTTVTLDGSVSTGDVETYEWRVGGSGSFDTTGRTTDVTLDFCGSLLVTLRVTGPDGEQSTASITLSTTE